MVLDFGTFLQPALAGIIVTVLTVVLTKAHAAVQTRASVANWLALFGGLAAALADPSFRAEEWADRLGPALLSVALTAVSSLAAFKKVVQPSLEADRGVVALLSRKTANIGFGSLPAAA